MLMAEDGGRWLPQRSIGDSSGSGVMPGRYSARSWKKYAQHEVLALDATGMASSKFLRGSIGATPSGGINTGTPVSRYSEDRPFHCARALASSTQLLNR